MLSFLASQGYMVQLESKKGNGLVKVVTGVCR